MAKTKTNLPEPEKLLAELKPNIHQRIFSELKKLGPGLKQLSQGGLRVFFTGAILLPLAAAGADSVQIAQAVAAILGGIGTEHFSEWIKKFCNAAQEENEALKTQLMAEATDQILVDLQNLVEKVDALAAAQQAIGAENANWIRQNLFPIRPIPADDADHLAFREQVKRIYMWGGWFLEQEDAAFEGQPVDFVFSKSRLGADPDRLIVHCVDTRQGRVDEAMLTPILPALGAARELRQAQNGVLVTNFGFSPGVSSMAKRHGWSIRYYDQLVAELIDFRPYLAKLRDRWENDEDCLSQYYVPVEFDDNGKRRDLFEYVTNEWLTQPQNFLSIVGEYGVGKTSFCRKLAYELAGRHNSRIPILIQLYDAKYNVGVKGLVRAMLAENGMPEVSYEAFDQMNRAGLLLILLDGFDEMIAQADFESIKKAFNNLAELAAAPESRVILSSRDEYFESEQEREKILQPKPTLATPIKQKRDRWALQRLAKFSPEQMRQFLERRLPLIEGAEGNADFYLQKMGEIEDLLDLGQRAVMLDMIAKSLPGLIKGKKEIDPAVLYQEYLHGELERQEGKRGLEWTKRTPRPQRFKLMRALAVDAWKNKQPTFPAAKVTALIEQEFPKAEADDVKSRSRDFLTCSFLIRPGDAHYKFSHRSIQEYLLAEDAADRLLKQTDTEALALSTAAINFIHYLMWPKVRDGLFYRQQAESALKKDGPPDWIKKKGDRYFSALPGGFEVEMVYVPAGPFVLGAETDGLPPQIAMLDRGYWIDKTPVTVRQFNEFAKATNYITEAEKGGGGWTFSGKEWKQTKKANWRDPFALGSKIEEILDHPVVQISWNDAQAFCEWAHKELPFEVLWEKAARGIDGRWYPWGNQWNRDNCNSASYWAKRDLFDYEKEWKPWWEKEFPKQFAGKQPMTTAVGAFKGMDSPFGCVDSAGNVWEWCADEWEKGSKTRVLRGGAWDYHPRIVACANRYGDDPDLRNYVDIGFRCART